MAAHFGRETRFRRERAAQLGNQPWSCPRAYFLRIIEVLIGLIGAFGPAEFEFEF